MNIRDFAPIHSNKRPSQMGYSSPVSRMRKLRVASNALAKQRAGQGEIKRLGGGVGQCGAEKGWGRVALPAFPDKHYDLCRKHTAASGSHLA